MRELRRHFYNGCSQVQLLCHILSTVIGSIVGFVGYFRGKVILGNLIQVLKEKPPFFSFYWPQKSLKTSAFAVQKYFTKSAYHFTLPHLTQIAFMFDYLVLCKWKKKNHQKNPYNHVFYFMKFLNTCISSLRLKQKNKNLGYSLAFYWTATSLNCNT